MSPADHSSRPPRQLPDLQLNEVADGLVVFSPSDQRVHHLNQTAAAVFVLCDGSASLADIADAMTATFGADDWGPRVTECVADLAARGLVA